eukprot:scpid90298/ scgid0023/ 
MEVSEQALEPLERAIHHKLIPAITGRSSPNDSIIRLFALPYWPGGLAIMQPSTIIRQYETPRFITAPIVQLIKGGIHALGDALDIVRKRKNQSRSSNRRGQSDALSSVIADSSPTFVRTIDLARERGASSWLTCKPLRRYGFNLTKCEFRDGLCLRDGWTLQRLPSSCVCGVTASVSHLLSCPVGGFPSIRHNEIRDVTASLLKIICNNVAIEPSLQPLTGERLRYRTAITEDQARLDIGVSGLWGSRFERTLIDVRVFNPHAASNRTAPLATVYHRHEQEKRRKYE